MAEAVRAAGPVSATAAGGGAAGGGGAKKDCGPAVGKSGKKVCCACPETRKARDACVVGRGEEHCGAEIEAHRGCLREDGFKV